MTMKRILALFVLACTVLFTLCGWAIERLVITPEFLRIERMQAEENLQRALSALEREITTLNGICRDWASWDDAYRFLADRNAMFIKSNLAASSFSDNHLNLILFYDLAGSYVAGNTFDLQENSFSSVADFPLTTLPAALSPFFPPAGGQGGAGMINTSRGPLLFSCRPILQSDNSGPPRGVLVMGYFLDDRVIGQLGEQVVQELRISPVTALSAPDQKIMDGLGRSHERSSLVADRQVMHAYTTFPDVQGNPLLLIRVDFPRDIFRQSQRTTQLFLGLTVAAGAVVIICMLALFQAKIVGPIGALVMHIVAIRTGGDRQALAMQGVANEVCTLGHEFDTLIAELADKDREQERSARERERLIAELQAALAKVKQLKGMLPICASCKKIRDDRGYWTQIENYIRDHSEANFTHGICGECALKLYPELYDAETGDMPPASSL